MNFLKFLFKIIIVVVIVFVVSKLEYNGRKIETYVLEAFSSGAVQSAIGKEKKGEKPMSDIPDDERKELQNIMEQ